MPYRYTNSFLDRVGEKACLVLAILITLLALAQVVLFFVMQQLQPAGAAVPTSGLVYDLAAAFVIIACFLPVLVILFVFLLLAVLYAEQKYLHDNV